MKTKTLSWQDVESQIHELAFQINKSKWRPDYVVGITRGGLTPALLLSTLLGVPMETLKVQLRDGNNNESNCWMAEDAFGYVPEDQRDLVKSRWDSKFQKNILIVDDINDSGSTFEWIKDDWQKSCLPNEYSWETVWGGNVRFATLVENLDSKIRTHYNAVEINKAENDVWINFPWESGWWIRHTKEL